MAALSTIFNFEHPAFEFHLYDLAQDIAFASSYSILLGVIFNHGAGIIQYLLADRFAPGYIHVAKIGLRLFAFAEFMASPIRLSLYPIFHKPQMCPNKRPFLNQYIQGALRIAITGASFLASIYFDKPLRALHPYAPAMTAAIVTTHNIWRPFIRLRYLEEIFVEIFRQYCLSPIRQNLYNWRSLLSSNFLVIETDAPLFQYPQLSAGNMVRLLKIQVKKSSANWVSCELLAFDIDSAPPYDAISYTWGSAEHKYSLLIGDTVKQCIPITASAGDALRAVTPLYGTYYLWIDSICINQRDEAEKDQQIPLMRKIYGRANEVIVSLGNSPSASAAVSFLNRIYWYYICKNQNLLKTVMEKNGHIRTGFTINLPFLEEDQNWDAWRNFVDNNYWTRVWVIQECIVAQEITVIYGGLPLAWDIVCLVVLIMRSSVSRVKNDTVRTGYDSGERIGFILAHRSEYVKKGPVRSLAELVVDSRDSLATNPADKVNALLGLSQDSGVPAIQPDHRRSVKEVYANVVKLALQTGSFYTFSMSGLSCRQEGNSLSKLSEFQDWIGLSGLPSWIPDLTLRHTRDTSRYHGRDYTAGAKIPVEFNISAQQDQLRLKGVFLDTIKATSLQSDLPEVIRLALENADHPDGLQLGRDLWNRLIEMLELFELHLPIVQDQYSESDARECFWQTITDDFDGQKFPERDELTRILQDLERFVAALKLEISNLLLESEKLPVKEFTSYLTSSHAAKHFWSKNDESEIINLVQATFESALGISEKGFLAQAPLGTRAGDVIVVFQGSPVPHILRATGKGDGSYFIWGEAYVHGVMYGKAMDAERTWFVLC